MATRKQRRNRRFGWAEGDVDVIGVAPIEGKAFIMKETSTEIVIRFGNATDDIATDGIVSVKHGEVFEGWKFSELQNHPTGEIEIPKEVAA